jgi:mono/diheme cytochrome c family protein
MKIPVGLKVAALVVLTTAFYTYLGQLVPQKQVAAPQVIELSEDLTTADLIDIGAGIADGKGLCLTCHTIGDSGALRFPDLAGIGSRAATRIEGMSGLEYLAQSLYEPDVYLVEGFNGGMPKINKAPIGLTDDEILAVLAWLQSLGGDPTVDMQTVHAYNEGS